MKILKMRFSILHTFHQISRTFYFWNDLDLAGDLDLWPKVTKKNLYNPRCVLDIYAKNEVDPTIGLGGVRPHTDRQTNRGPTAIIV